MELFDLQGGLWPGLSPASCGSDSPSEQLGVKNRCAGVSVL